MPPAVIYYVKIVLVIFILFYIFVTAWSKIIKTYFFPVRFFLETKFLNINLFLGFVEIRMGICQSIFLASIQKE